MEFYERVVRPVLFRTLSAERAHDLAHVALRSATLGRVIGGRPGPSLPRRYRLGPLDLVNPIGLAPGFDKNGRSLAALDHLGFGYLNVGSVTPLPRDGNPRPRMVRYPDERALGNAMGLPSIGADRVADNLRRAPTRAPTRSTPVIASIAGFVVDEMCQALDLVAPLVDGIELQLFCPNAEERRTLDQPQRLTDLLAAMRIPPGYPVFVKLPYFDGDASQRLAFDLLAISRDHPAVVGVSVVGGLRRDQPGLAAGHGSITGAPALERTVRLVGEVRERAGDLAIKASGGVATGADAARLLAAGATTVELYTALVYRGPRVARRIVEELHELGATPAQWAEEDAG